MMQNDTKRIQKNRSLQMIQKNLLSILQTRAYLPLDKPLSPHGGTIAADGVPPGHAATGFLASIQFQAS